ncbi:MAG: hypothetical protein WCB01_02420 [Candidatus Cybelea sp.]
MGKGLLLVRSVLGIGAIGAMLAGCGGSQSGFRAMPQNAPEYVGSAVQPNAACSVVGKTYTTGKGHANVKYGATKYAVGFHWDRVTIDLHFTKWPQNRRLPDWVTLLTTCGPQSGNKPIGKILNRVSPLDKSCHNGICNYNIPDFVVYEPPIKLPNNKPWKYDELVVKFKTFQKGWGTLPGARIEIVK